MKREDKTFVLLFITTVSGLMGILLLTTINITLANMYPEIRSVILGVHGIGIVVGILMCVVGSAFGFSILHCIKMYRLNSKTAAFSEKT